LIVAVERLLIDGTVSWATRYRFPAPNGGPAVLCWLCSAVKVMAPASCLVSFAAGRIQAGWTGSPKRG